MLCGDDSWTLKSIRINLGHLRVMALGAKSPLRTNDQDDVIDLKQITYIHTDLRQSELPSTAKQGNCIFNLVRLLEVHSSVAT